MFFDKGLFFRMLPLEMNWVCLVQGCRVLEKGFESYASGIFILKVRNSLLSPIFPEP